MTALSLDPSIGSRCDIARELNLLDREALAVLSPLVDQLDPGVFGLWLLAGQGLGASIGVALASSLPRPHTGYMPEDQRRAVLHLSYSEGLLEAPRRLRAEDRAKLEAAKLFDDVRGAA